MDYLYRGDKCTAPELKDQLCKAVRRENGKCIRARTNGNMLVEFEGGLRVVIVGRRLKKLVSFTKPHTMDQDQNKAFKSFKANAKYDPQQRNYFIEHGGTLLDADTPAELVLKYLDAQGIQRPATPKTTIEIDA